MPRSLRTRLLAWYSLILAAVVAIFAGIVGYLLWRSMLGDIDERLRASAIPLVQALRPVADGGFDLDLPLEHQPGDATPAPATYYAVWNADGEIVDRSTVAFDIPPPLAAGVRTRDGRRELVMGAAGGALVLVGRDLSEARAAVRTFAGMAAIGGFAALLISLAGGWFLIGRALAPIGRINRTAAAMTAGDLRARIAIEDTENELEHVALALNGAFDRLHRALDGQRRFTSDASHELRTPVATVLAETEWALSRSRRAEDYHASLIVCRRATERMALVVDRLLTLARADHDAIRLDRGPVPLEPLVHDALALVRPLATSKGVTIETKLDAATVDGDRDRLTELLTNLCANAVEYNRRGGHVSIEVWPEGAEACMRIRDSGMGIEENEVPRIFERFYRADRARQGRPGGAGLGLAIAKSIVDAHGGRISCHSRPGEGTEMVVRLPRIA